MIDPDRQSSLKHQISTLTGTSGAPILLFENNKISIVGIHKGGHKVEKANAGRLVTAELIKELQQ